QSSLIELIRRTSAEIPDDVQQAIVESLENEKRGTIAEYDLKIIERNIQLAKQKYQPICIYYVIILIIMDVTVCMTRLKYNLEFCIGVERANVYELSKEQFLRRIPDRNPNAELDALEQDILKTANELGIGPMGFGGKTTLLGVKIGAANRLPASYFVSISYMC